MGLSMMGINDYDAYDMAFELDGTAGREISRLRKQIKNLTVQNRQLTAAYCDLKEDFDIIDAKLYRMEHAEIERKFLERLQTNEQAGILKSVNPCDLL